MKKLSVLYAFIGLILGGCIFGDQGDYFEIAAEVSHPVVTLSKNEVAVGEFIQVTITNKVVAQSKIQEKPAEVGLALCLRPDWLDTLDNCRPVDSNGISFEPSDDFTVKQDDAIVKRFTLDIRRNETYELSHTLSITANRAGTVTLIGRFDSYSHIEVPGNVISVGPDEEAFITFK